ncbi:hypothetical protein LTR17_007233 [Elasticomyces elasticus]|nr:hypothetical protein LTR17_007233 [Elasticomyces elasticus]
MEPCPPPAAWANGIVKARPDNNVLSLKPPLLNQRQESSFNALTEDQKIEESKQYYGYPVWARHQASGHDFFLLRRFAPLQVRCLRHLQNEIGTLELQLNAWDDFVTKQHYGDSNNATISDDDWPPRVEIIRRLVPLVQQYNDHVLSFAKVRALPTASKHHIENLENWFANYPESVAPGERHDVNNHGDLFPLVSIPKTPLFTMLERIGWLQVLFARGHNSDHLGLPEESHWSDKAFETLATFVTITFGLGLLYAPVWWLRHTNSNAYQLGVITGFTSLFALCSWISVGNKPLEILFVAILYAGVVAVSRPV